jgi:Glycosyltransferase family 87/WD40-like Beta Propeller Repeat
MNSIPTQETSSLPKKTRELRALVFAEWLSLAALVAVFIVQGFIPAWRTMNTDFPNYFLAAVIHHQGTPIDRAYEWRWFQRHKDHEQIDQSLVGFAPHPPLCAAPMLPLAALPSLEAKRVWLVFNLILLGLSIWILSRVTPFSLRRLGLLTFLCVLPLRDEFLFGQYYVVILFLICLAYYAHDRGHRATSGIVLAAAASLKIFPAFFLILFLRKRNWRAAAGLVAGGLVFAAVSILLFGWNVHRVLLTEVLPRALHGDMVGPYVLQWNSFTALCHRIFLAEPELNPLPWINSPAIYAIAQALISTGLLFSFLFFTDNRETRESTAWEWGTFVLLLLLLSSMPTPYHFCVLIFTAALAIDRLLKNGARGSGICVTVLFAIACYPLPAFAWLTLQARLVAAFLLYLLLLFNAPSRAPLPVKKILVTLAVLFFAGLTFSNLRSLKDRSADFFRRLSIPPNGYGTFAAVKAGDRILLDEMIPDAFGAMILPGGAVQPMPAPGDVLAIAASAQSPWIYFELTNQHSQILRLPVTQIGATGALPEFVADGEDPAISSDGRWLAFFREDHGRTTIWISKDGAPPALAPGSQNVLDVLEVTVTPTGDIIAAVAGPANPHLTMLHIASGEIELLPNIAGAVRYPAISPEGKHLAFSRRESGSWHLFVRNLATGAEEQLTIGSCNAINASWEDSQSLLYVSDCGRGLNLSAPARVRIAP